MSHRRMPSEAQLDHIDSLVHAYAALAGHINRVEDLEIAITSAYVEAVETETTFNHLTSILGPYVKSAEAMVRKAAWAGQHLFDAPPLCVGNRICTMRDNAYGSPLVDQIAELGYSPRDVRYSRIVDDANQAHYIKRIDGLFFSGHTNRLFPMKSVAVDSKFLGVSSRRMGGPSLFPRACWLEHGEVPSTSLASLVAARMILSSAFPNIEVVPVLLMIDTASWNFQVHDGRGLSLRQLRKDRVHLADLPRFGSSVEMSGKGPFLDRFESVPRLPTEAPLSRLPVDRATRSYMILDYLWDLQSEMNELVIVSASEIATAVRQRYLLAYPPDLRRHDIEDCLERGGFIERPRYDSSGYALTATGVARILIMRQQLKESAKAPWDGDPEAEILAPIRKQAHLWAAYKNGDYPF